MITFRHLISLDSASVAAINHLADAIEKLSDTLAGEPPRMKGGAIVFIVKDNNPDVRYSITAPEVTDEEGNVIPAAQLSYEVTSDAPDVVSITADEGDELHGTVHFGAPGQAAINVNVKSGETLLGAFGAQFTVTTGDPAAIVGGGITFAGLTES